MKRRVNLRNGHLSPRKFERWPSRKSSLKNGHTENGQLEENQYSPKYIDTSLYFGEILDFF